MGLVRDCWVTPRGERLPARDRGSVDGRVMGNRHYGDRWIVCDRDWSAGDARERTYDVLFFLDEATALAAGHRPCWTCRREAAAAFIDRWPGELPTKRRVDSLDRVLVSERAGGAGRLVDAVADLPTGAFVEVDGEPCVLDGPLLRRWTPTGYADERPASEVAHVTLLTPPSTLEVLRAGYPLGPLGGIDRPSQERNRASV